MPYTIDYTEAARYHLTPSEISVLSLTAEDFPVKEIAEELSVKPVTIRSHLKSIADKLEVRNRRNLVLAARESGILIKAA